MSKYLSILFTGSRHCISMHSLAQKFQRMQMVSCRCQRRKLLNQRVMYSSSVASQPVSEPEPIPPAIPEPYISEDDRIYPEKIQKLVAEISKLTLLEVADLNDLLKKTLRIKDAPMMAMGSMAAPASEEEEENIPKKEKTSFTVKLMQFDSEKKVQLIKYIKTVIEGMNLVQAKKFVESVPQVVHSDIGKDEAEKLKAAIEEAGGVVEVE